MAFTVPATIEVQDLFGEMSVDDMAEFFNEFGRWYKNRLTDEEKIDLVEQLSSDGNSGIISLHERILPQE